jgi:hypothetical protein
MGNSNSSANNTQPPEPEDGPSVSASNCPVVSDSRGPVYNVYNQRIDTGEPLLFAVLSKYMADGRAANLEHESTLALPVPIKMGT